MAEPKLAQSPTSVRSQATPVAESAAASTAPTPGKATLVCEPGVEPPAAAAALIETARAEIDGENRYKVLLNVVVVGRRQGTLGAVIDALGARPHPLHGTYLDALIRGIHIGSSAGLRDAALAILASHGIGRVREDAVVTLTPGDKLVRAAALGMPDLAPELVHQARDALLGIPLVVAAIGLGAVIGPLLVELGALALLGADVGHDLLVYHRVATDAQSEQDLRVAGHYAAKAAATAGFAALLTAITKLLARLRTRKPPEEKVEKTPAETERPAEQPAAERAAETAGAAGAAGVAGKTIMGRKLSEFPLLVTMWNEARAACKRGKTPADTYEAVRRAFVRRLAADTPRAAAARALFEASGFKFFRTAKGTVARKQPVLDVPGLEKHVDADIDVFRLSFQHLDPKGVSTGNAARDHAHAVAPENLQFSTGRENVLMDTTPGGADVRARVVQQAHDRAAGTE